MYVMAISMTVTWLFAGTRSRGGVHAMEVPRQISEYFLHSTELRLMHPCVPNWGASALDAVELMDVGVNYMREHMIDEARIHYAHNRYRRRCPKCSQSRAQVLYAIRAPKITQVKELYNRVCNIARGAALMTETTVEIRQVAAYSNLISSKILADHMNAYLEKLGPITYTEEEYAYAQKFQQSLSDQDKNNSRQLPGTTLAPKLQMQ